MSSAFLVVMLVLVRLLLTQPALGGHHLAGEADSSAEVESTADGIPLIDRHGAESAAVTAKADADRDAGTTTAAATPRDVLVATEVHLSSAVGMNAGGCHSPKDGSNHHPHQHHQHYQAASGDGVEPPATAAPTKGVDPDADVFTDGLDSGASGGLYNAVEEAHVGSAAKARKLKQWSTNRVTIIKPRMRYTRKTTKG